MDRDEFTEWVATGCAHLSYTNKHAHKVAAEGRPVFDEKGNPCIEVVTRVPVTHLPGVEFVRVEGGGGATATATIPLTHFTDPVNHGLVHNCEIVDALEDALPPDAPPDADTPPYGTTTDPDKVTCPSCRRMLARVYAVTDFYGVTYISPHTNRPIGE